MAKVRFVKQYTINSSGNQFMRFEAETGHIAEIRTRVGRQGLQVFTRAEAKAIATEHFYGNCGGRFSCPVTVHY